MGYKKFLGPGYKKFLEMGYKKYLGITVDIFTGFSCERFLGIFADFPQNFYLGSLLFDKLEPASGSRGVNVYRGTHGYRPPPTTCLVSGSSGQSTEYVYDVTTDVTPEVNSHEIYLSDKRFFLALIVAGIWFIF